MTTVAQRVDCQIRQSGDLPGRLIHFLPAKPPSKEKNMTTTQTTKSGFKPHYGITFLIGMGFFTMGLMDPLYDTYVPVFLDKFISSKGLISSSIILDNVFAIFLIPIVAAWSERTRTAIGRRMPLIPVTLPLTAISFALLLFSALAGLAALVIMRFVSGGEGDQAGEEHVRA